MAAVTRPRPGLRPGVRKASSLHRKGIWIRELKVALGPGTVGILRQNQLVQSVACSLMDRLVLKCQLPIHPHQEPDRGLCDIVVESGPRRGVTCVRIRLRREPLLAVTFDAVGIVIALHGIQFDNVVPPTGTMLAVRQNLSRFSSRLQIESIPCGCMGSQVGESYDGSTPSLNRHLRGSFGSLGTAVRQVRAVSEVVPTLV